MSKSALWIIAYAVVWVVGTPYGYLSADPAKFRCYGGSNGFFGRVWQGFVDPKYPTKEDPYPNAENAKRTNDRLKEFGHSLSGPVELPEPRVPPENKLYIVVSSAVTGFSLGSSIRYALNAHDCPSLLSPLLSHPDIVLELNTWPIRARSAHRREILHR